ncbi:hypothetical protein Nepgr_014215 [Nepenthes gracilis]|uniref:Uncharacterized protein n=1 Tax=Nepenthes gracilis TaxID=150966 RepID=A0AAD3XPX8_NEPGR|nr:hypothetical protein Nepgr_014215 [Nepenthes gracilis]
MESLDFIEYEARKVWEFGKVEAFHEVSGVWISPWPSGALELNPPRKLGVPINGDPMDCSATIGEAY